MALYSRDYSSSLHHLHPETVRRKLQQRIIRGFRVGRKWLIPKEEIIRLRALENKGVF